jgi:galactokinase
MLIARAPGRVTLIGDHTDYNQGLSLPMAIDLATEATFTPKAGSFLIGVASDQYPEPWEIPLGGTAPDPPQAALAAALVALAHPSSGGALRVTSTLPVGAGLSSSAAFSVAVLLALGGREDMGPGGGREDMGPGGGREDMAAEDTLSLARLCQSAEDAAGSRVGLLDPLAILRAQQGHALAIDFARLESHQVPIPENAAFVVVHCGTSRALGSSAYALRRAECERAENLIGRPLGLCALGDLSALPDPVLRRRARHVITECGRVREVERLLLRSNLTGAGAVMTDGHRSLAEDFRVSIPALDELVDRLVGLPGVYGARMTGGGFGGCAIALCAPDSPALSPESHAPLPAWRVSPAQGAEVRVAG